MSVKNLIFLFLGIAAGIVVYLIIDDFADLKIGEMIDIIAIIVNIIIGAIIVIIVQKRLSDDRGVKDYFIQEVGEIKTDYTKFINLIFKNKTQPKFVLEWFKIMSSRVFHLEQFLEHDLKIKNVDLKVLNRSIQRLITNDSDFNNSFNKSSYNPNSLTKHQISELVKDLKYAFVHTIIRINKA